MIRQFSSSVSKVACLSKSSRQMGSISLKAFGSPTSVLEYSSGKVDSASPSAGEVKVSVKASAVSYEDIRHISGLSFVNKSFGVAGTSAVGSVTAVGPAVTGISVGDNVLIVGSGVWSDTATISAASVAKVNNSLTSTEAATLPTLVSAWAILSSACVQAGDVVLLSGRDGSSGLGLAIADIGKAFGLTVQSIDDKAATVAPPKGVKLVITSSTGKQQIDLLKMISGKDGGMLVHVNGPVMPLSSIDGVGISVTSSVFENKAVKGFDFSSWARSNPSGLAEGIAKVSELLAAKKITAKPSLFAQADFAKAINAASNGTIAVLN